MTQYINIDPRYGDAVGVTLADYRQLNPSGDFYETDSGIWEHRYEDDGSYITTDCIAMTWAEWEGKE